MAEAVVESWDLLACAARWRPGNWADTLRPAHAVLTRGATGLEASAAWATVAMIMGDSGATPLALIVCLHGERSLPAHVEDRGLAAHRDLCLLDLGLGRAAADGPIKLADLGAPGTVGQSSAEVEYWLDRALVPFDGDLGRAARFALALAAVRTGLVAGPEPTP
ncbi:MAG TPA: hypothetical protein VFQ53_08590 [Kofleriaceae bacterium]|nr:hypothetical protein [Kofleriaceae bacterium]